MKNSPYKLYDDIVIRTPIFPLSALFSSEHLELTIAKAMDNIFFRNALVLSSYSFYQVLEKYSKHPEGFSDRKKEKIHLSFLKYWNRICTRSTPFGMFAALCPTDIKNLNLDAKEKGHPNIEIQASIHFQVLHAIVNFLSKNYSKDSSYTLNNSLFEKDAAYHFTKAEKLKGKLIFKTHSVEKNEILDFLYAHKNNRIRYTDLLNELQREFPNYDPKDLEYFIKDCIQNSILNNAIALTARAEISSHRILRNEIQRININNSDMNLGMLTKIFDRVENLSAESIIKKELELISETLDELNIEHSKNKLLFVNSYYHDFNTVNITEKHLKKSVQKGLHMLNRFLIPKKDNSWIEKFKKVFKNSYGDKMMPFNVVFDPLIGLNYPIENKKDSHAEVLLHEIYVPGTKKENFSMASKHKFWFEKYLHCIAQGKEEILITEEDLLEFEAIYATENYTFSSLVSVVEDPEKQNKEPYIYMKNTASGSGKAYLGRFSHTNDAILDLCQRMAAFEENANSDKINAEITHIPNMEIGDIINHKSFHSYELPYLINSLTEKEFIVGLEDLYLGIENNEFVIYSTIHKKYVNLFLSNAYNFSLSEHPAFTFLCDYQHRKSVYTPNFSIGPWSNKVPFVPRIRYENILLKPKTWLIDQNLLLEVSEDLISEQHFFAAIKAVYKSLPDKLQLGQNDQLLYINLDENNGSRLFHNYCLKRFKKGIKQVRCIEAFEPNSSFANEILLSFNYEIKKL